eukprot:TRINITY_DN6670_c0_g1_i1.p1 TRINITY_DN6670_c0_g1~~TRINITY_DN6670_c0_g1_i1.p1  ORF type:complete len:278 (-),score=105.55 TRINITY_DN6670_c0_g1_i1:1068-1901(-)
MGLTGNNDEEKLESLCQKTYKEQAIWFLNAFWKELGEKEGQNLWDYVKKSEELDTEKKSQGNQLDEMMAHRFLEKNDKTLTVVTLRQKLQQAGIDKNTKRKYIPLTHFLIIHYNVSYKTLVNASQGENEEEVAKAQKMLDEVKKAFADARRAQEELEASLRELRAQEEAFNQKTEELKKKSESGGAVQMNKAKNELAQHLGSDPLPLRKAKITTEAATKKAEKASAEAARRVEEAEKYLEEVKKMPGSAKGQIWWIERELHEAKAYAPQSKGGYKKK